MNCYMNYSYELFLMRIFSNTLTYTFFNIISIIIYYFTSKKSKEEKDCDVEKKKYEVKDRRLYSSSRAILPGLLHTTKNNADDAHTHARAHAYTKR